MAETSTKGQNQKKGESRRSDAPLPWLSWRYRLSLQQFQRGKKKNWHFSGQQPGEDVIEVVRRHWWFLAQPGLPVLGSAVALFALVTCSVSWPNLNFLWGPLEIAAFLALLGTGGYFAYKDLITWWYETYIITNKRIINSRGLLEPTRQSTPLEKVQQIGIDINHPLGLILGFGTVRVYLTGGDFLMRDVPRPRRVRDAIMGITEAMKEKAKPDTPQPKPKDPGMAAVLEALAKEKPVPKLPDVDAHLPPVPGSDDRFIGPRRTFGGILRVPCNVRYVSGEYTVKYVQRSLYVLWSMMAVPVLIILLLVPTMLLTPATGIIPASWLGLWWPVTGLGVLASFVWILLIYFNFVDDVYILTNRRIIDIQRFFFFFSENHLEVEYKSVRDIRVRVNNLVERFLDVGDVYIETPGNNPDIVLAQVDHPFILQDELLGIRSHKEKEDAVNKENKDIQNLHKWFGTVLSKLEETTKSRGVPNLRDMHVISAMACAQEYGLKVTVRGEDDRHPEVQPGHVVFQEPPPGTLMEKDSNIEIVLSRRPVPMVAREAGGPG